MRGLAGKKIGAGRRKPEPAVGPDLSWVDEFIRNVRPYVFVRTEDNLLIKMPNQATRLNSQGARILEELLGGGTVSGLLDRVGRDPRKIRDIALFLYEVKRYLEGGLDEFSRTEAVEVESFDHHFSRLPVLSEIALTYRCNLRCTFCYAGCNCTSNPAGDTREMSTSEVRHVLDQIYHEARVPSVSFTGGEATIRKDLPELVRYALDLGMRVNLITNGTLITPDSARELKRAGLASAQVSLEGVRPETHEKLTRIPGSFQKSVASVGFLRQAGVRVHTNTTINRENLEECIEMPAFVRRVLGCSRFSMNLLIPAGSAVLSDSLVVTYREIGPRLLEIQQAAREESVEFMWYSPTPMCMFNPVAHQLGNKGCSACDGLISVAANGDVLPCSSYDEPVGNLLADRVLDIWNSEKASWFREKKFAHPDCRTCEDFQVCHGACPIYWRRMGFEELDLRRCRAPENGVSAP